MYSFDHDFLIETSSVYNKTGLPKLNKLGSLGKLDTAPDLLKDTCPISTLVFVVNATDISDECGGLRKAFANSCSDQALALNDKKLRRKRRKDRMEKKHQEMENLGNSQLKDKDVRKAVGSYTQSDNNSTEAPNSRKLLNYNSSIAKLHNDEQENILEGTNGDDKMEKTADGIVTGDGEVEKTSEDEVLIKLPTLDEGSVSALGSSKDNTKSLHTSLGTKNGEIINESEISETVVEEEVDMRMCCTSILKVYHEECDDTSSDLSDKKLGLIVFIIALCGLVKSLIRNYELNWLSEAGGCILVGMCAGFFLQMSDNWKHVSGFDESFFLRVMLPPIVFEASLAINKPAFNFHVIPILVFAIFGTIISTTLTSLIVHYGSAILPMCSTIPMIESFAFGALISSIDPVATLSILSSLGIDESDTIYVLVFGESLLNDGVAVVLFNTILHFLDDNMTMDSDAVFHGIMNFAVVSFGSIAVGLLCGVFCTIYFRFMHGCHKPLVEVLVFFCWAMIPYYICDDYEWSGIVALVAAGFMMDLYVLGGEGEVIDRDNTPGIGQNCLDMAVQAGSRIGRRRSVFTRYGHLSNECKKHVSFVLEVISTSLETAIFAYLGMFLFNARYQWNIYLSTIAIFACISSRALMVIGMSNVSRLLGNFFRCFYQVLYCRSGNEHAGRRKESYFTILDKKLQLILWFSGLRGAMSFALVEFVPIYDATSGHGSRFKAELKSMTCASIFFTIFVFGGGTFYLMQALGYSSGSKYESDDEESRSLVLAAHVKSSPMTNESPSSNSSHGQRGDHRNNSDHMRHRLFLSQSKRSDENK